VTDAARILVVDDDPGVVRAVSRVLGRQHEVLPTTSPESALAEVESFNPDVAIVDVRMPQVDGFELMRQLREQRPDVDVIIMTGSIVQQDAHLVRAIDEGAFFFIQKPFDRRVLQALVGRCLDLRRLREEKQRQMARLERELAAARKFQRSLLPPSSRTLEGVTVSARSIACDELGGDLYDYAAAGNGRAAVLVADVSGHGAPAAMITGIVKSAFHAARAERYEPEAVVHRVADAISSFSASRFVTLVCARIDSRAPALEYVSAGHPPVLVHARGSTPRSLDSTGPLISSGFRDLPWEQRSVELERSQRLLLYTDGIIEAPGPEGQFGQERVAAAFGSSSRHGVELLDELVAGVAAYSGNRPARDDLTLLTVDLN
jgi:serine phosphatase RsbU (regulator of sigma subunit)